MYTLSFILSFKIHTAGYSTCNYSIIQHNLFCSQRQEQRYPRLSYCLGSSCALWVTVGNSSLGLIHPKNYLQLLLVTPLTRMVLQCWKGKFCLSPMQRSADDLRSEHTHLYLLDTEQSCLAGKSAATAQVRSQGLLWRSCDRLEVLVLLSGSG